MNNHELQNKEERKFEELRPLLRDFSNMSTYPTLPEIERETEYLLKAKENLIRTNAPNRQIE